MKIKRIKEIIKMFTENSNTYAYNTSSSCKYRLPCGWCDRKNCVCTYPYTTTLYSVSSNTASNSEAISSSIKANVETVSDNNGFINATESFLKG